MEIEDYPEDVVIKIEVRKVSLTSQVTFQKFIMKVSNYVKAFFRIVRFAIRNLQNKAIYKITFQKFIKVPNINALESWTKHHFNQTFQRSPSLQSIIHMNLTCEKVNKNYQTRKKPSNFIYKVLTLLSTNVKNVNSASKPLQL